MAILKDHEKNERLLRDFFSGFVKIHVLYHTGHRPFYGQELKDELKEHGYSISYGTLYPLLHKLCAGGYLAREDRSVDGKVRKYYSLTAPGSQVLEDAKRKLRELVEEVLDDRGQEV
jgi:PadR family transcriptional regulator, regulatory protein PadR